MSHEYILSNSIVLYQSTPVSGYTDGNFLLSAPTIHTLVECEKIEVTQDHVDYYGMLYCGMF